MKSTFKVAIPIVILLAVIFGVTFFSQYVPREPEPDKGQAGDPPLRFTTSSRVWLPPWLKRQIDDEHAKGNFDNQYKIQDVFFPGFFEPDSPGGATFWFENRNTSGVKLRLQQVSCTTCSEGSVYIIPPATTRLTLEMSLLSTLPQGLCSGLPLGMAGPGALFDQKHLPATVTLPFVDPSQVVFNIPGANDPEGWTPCWGILRLGFNAKSAGEGRRLTATFTSVVDDNPAQTGRDEFEIIFDVIEPIRMFPPTIDFGTLEESSAPEPREIIVYSCTRKPDALPAPILVPRSMTGGDAGRFLMVGKPVPVPESELDALSYSISEKLKRSHRITAAYRVPVKLNMKVDNERLDIGLLERTIDASAPGITVPIRSVPVRAVVRGGVWLPEGTIYDLGGFKARDGVTNSTFELVTDRPDIKVKVAEGQQFPEFVQVSLEEQKPLGGKGLYKVKIHIPPGKQVGLINNGVVVFEIVGPNSQRVRIPLKGRGDL